MSKNKPKTSIFAEFNALSAGAAALLTLIIIVCIAAYAYMQTVPAKKVILIDDAKIFSKEEERELEDVMDTLRRKKDINVVVVTTRDKGRKYSNSDEDCARYAGDIYKEKAIRHQFQDNSGICIFIDLTIDKDGQRFFWIYTYGTAYYSITDDECTGMFRKQINLLKDGEYYEAVNKIISKDLMKYSFDEGVGVTYFFNAVLPIILTWFTVSLLLKKKKLDKRPNSNKYKSKTDWERNEDKFLHKRVTVTHTSSSSGGGGGFSGGGGGGHSGGGGGRF